MKAYTTRVGEGPFPTELTGEQGDYIRETGREYGATTGRPRRCGWFDTVMARYSSRINGLSSLVITKLDVLDGVEEIKVCTGYEVDGKLLGEFPADSMTLNDCTPVYEILAGWQSDTSEVKKWEELPVQAQNYIEYIEKQTGVPVSMISVGPMRLRTIIK
jgi:adenylosuccinate synthase